ncbi:amidohydrolase family protein [Cytobacillus sp. Sa5YUA1]|uniref:Amidohydrolase family protein n=1 Tax=Cytobacillus stercorigallinarum TaxID=2762240 RepID=A0ABR8QLH8_9BACI|nr:amidohydrolase family protein [Cytobacillus stercorigallinarum]MBD7936380.1 amidohydrolase family protein [Cytobacillus stercorigallinarum]
MKVNQLIKNGLVVFPKEGVKAVDIGVINGKIAGIYNQNTEIEADEVIDANRLHVFPGVIDAHQHLGIYNSIEKDFLDTKQHAVGGITTIVNYDRQPVSYLDFFPKVQDIGEKHSYIDFTYSLGILTEQHIDELEETVKRFGLTSFKFFRNYERQLNDKFKISNGINLSSYDLMRLLEKFKSISPKLLLAIHCENMDINRSLIKKYKEEGAEEGLKTWSLTSPGFAEAESLLSTLYINSIVGGNVFIVHLTSGASIDVLEKMPWLLEKGVKVETCPHYLNLTEESSTGLKAKVGPPIHGQYDSDRLWEGIKEGIVNAIGTDHVPGSLATKFSKGNGVFEAEYGFPSAGALLPMMITEGHMKRGIPLERIADITSYQVAESFNLENKGRIEIGADADFAIVDLAKAKTISPEVLHSNSDYSIFDGFETVGWPVYTISRGEVIVNNGIPTKESGRGKFVRRSI